jgi:GT2 family glycosyltransferase
MSSRMTDVATPQLAEETTVEAEAPLPRVKVIITHVPGSDLDAALATVDRQVYGAVTSVEVVSVEPVSVKAPILLRESLADSIVATAHEVDYLWLVHSDARPRPDALNALVAEVERNDAALGGSKILVAGTKDELESIGSATDVFGEPYSGLDAGEIDLQQYDVVREVAFVSSVSMLVRRDLAQGLGGLDPVLEPGAAGLDFSQRVRLSGGRVIIIPSSEVYHQGRCGEPEGWRELAGRYRAMLKAYRLVTLAWVVPFGLILAVADSLANLLFLRWRPLGRYFMATGWNLWRLPSTIAARIRFRRVRSVGDEELFRFQARGSIRMRDVGSDISDTLLFMFDEDHALVRGTRRVWASPGIWGAILAAVIALFSARSFFFGGVPNAGYSFPFEPASTALARFLGGWNESALGSATPVHPSVGLDGLVTSLLFGHPGAARTLMTLGFSILAIVGMGRLMGRLGFRGPGRYLSGLVLLAGPGTALLTGHGSWLGLGAAAFLPWAVRAVFVHTSKTDTSRWTLAGWVVLWSLPLAALSPLAGLIPGLSVVLWRAVGGSRGRFWLAGLSVCGVVVAIPFLLGDPGWLTDPARRLGLSIPALWPILILTAAAALMLIEGRLRRLATAGAILAFTGMLLVNAGVGGPGVEETALVLASFGSAAVVSASLDMLSRNPLRVVAAVAAGAVLVLSIGSLADGRLGLAPGDENARFAFASTLSGSGGPGRLLLISDSRDAIPGEVRAGPGLWYRVIDGAGMTLDEVWMGPPAAGDDALEAALERIATGAELRPGELLAGFSIDWVVVIDGPDYLESIFQSQLDLVPTPLDPGSTVYDNPASLPLAAGSSTVWDRSGTGFAGPESNERVRISMNGATGWAPSPEADDWAFTVSADTGSASFRWSGLNRILPFVTAIILLAGLAAVVVGRVRS